MITDVSFEADAVRPEELSGVLVDYLTLEHLRVFRRLLVERFAILTAIHPLWLPVAVDDRRLHGCRDVPHPTDLGMGSRNQMRASSGENARRHSGAAH